MNLGDGRRDGGERLGAEVSGRPEQLRTEAHKKTTFGLLTEADVCVACGNYVPEGSQICAACVEKLKENI